MEKQVKERGYTIVPVRLYITDRGFAKVEIALAQARKYTTSGSHQRTRCQTGAPRIKKMY